MLLRIIYESPLNRFVNRISPKFIVLGLLFFLSLFSNAQQVPVKFSHLTVDNGLSHTDAKDIKQDNLGFIWIATLFGLDRFDGYSIKSFYNNLESKNNAFRNRIRSLYPDENGNVWLVTDDGIQCFDAKHERYLNLKTNTLQAQNLGYSKIIKRKDGTLFTLKSNIPLIHYITNEQVKILPIKYPEKEKFHDAVMDTQGRIWLCSNRDIWVLSTDNKFRQVVSFSSLQEKGPIAQLFINTKGMLSFVFGQTIGTTNLSVRQPDNDIIKNDVKVINQFKATQSLIINDVVQDAFQHYWVSTDEGLLLLDASLKPLQEIHATSLPNGLNTNRLAKLLIDRTQCLWVCSIGGGVNYIDLNAKRFYTLQHNPELKNTLSGNHIRAILEENEHILWIGTHENGLNRYDLRTKKFSTIDKKSTPLALRSDVINALTLDKKGNLWIATDKGIEILAKDRTTLLIPKGAQNFPTYSIQSLATDIFGNIWFGALERNMGRITLDSLGIYRVQYFSPAHFIFADANSPQVFAASMHGIIHFVLNQQGGVSRVFRYKNEGSVNPISSNYVWPIRKSSKNVLWAGTLGGGLNQIIIDLKGNYRAVSYSTKHGIFNDVECLEIDNNGNIWLSGRGLERFDPKTKTTTNYDYYDGLQGNSFKVGASLKGKDGRLYFGGINGLNYFYPDSIYTNSIQANPVFTGLLINNVKQEDTILSEGIYFSKKIALNYLQNNVVVSFSAMHYANPLKCKFRYKLEGLDKAWIQTDGKNPKATYSNLAYSDYTLLLQATNNDGIWSSKVASLPISVTPPWWKSFIAKWIYALLILAILISIYRYQLKWYSLKRAIEIRDIEEQKRTAIHQHKEELYQQQVQFFTNISHEFRTPLSLIIGPLEKLKKENKIADWGNTFHVMYKNASRLLSLINELMNLQKVSDNIIQLQVQPIQTSDFVSDIANEFEDLAENKGITFRYKNDSPDSPQWFDLQIVEKIILNLLSNAFKYTAENGEVTFSIFSDATNIKQRFNNSIAIESPVKAKKYTYFYIQDTGIGISEEFMPNIFERYYRVSNEHTGSGVGLALVKSLVLLHKGNIYVSSEIDKGTNILVALPCDEDDYTTTEKKDTKPRQGFLEKTELDTSLLNVTITTNLDDIQQEQVEQILIVEDNEELRLFMRSVLSQKYIVHEAPDGLSGFDLAKELIPDLIISDVMMPLLDGISLCKMIKDDFETSHIPFIILSAKDALEAKIQGLNFGADYYFAKPLSIELLLLTIHNVFEQKRKLKHKYTTDYYAKASALTQSTKDKEFLDNFLKLIEDNIQSEEIDVEYICEHFCISRTALYNKIKSISGQSVGEFIRTIRLKKAIHIMTHEQVTINEVVERIGLQSVSYFSRAFKKEFGKSPSVFIQGLKGN